MDFPEPAVPIMKTTNNRRVLSNLFLAKFCGLPFINGSRDPIGLKRDFRCFWRIIRTRT